MPPKYQVICFDGETRHSAPFATLTAALRWTGDGHECAPATLHDLVVRVDPADEIEQRDYIDDVGSSCLDAVEFQSVDGPFPRPTSLLVQ
jgi:hypothetical protein